MDCSGLTKLYEIGGLDRKEYQEKEYHGWYDWRKWAIKWAIQLLKVDY